MKALGASVLMAKTFCTSLLETSASDAKQAALEARTAVGEALTELQLLTNDPRVLELAARVIHITYNLYEAPDRADRDQRGVARAAHNAFVAAAGPLVRAWSLGQRPLAQRRRAVEATRAPLCAGPVWPCSGPKPPAPYDDHRDQPPHPWHRP
jgi:DUF1680 family protein